MEARWFSPRSYFLDPTSREMSFYNQGGNVKIVSLSVNKLGSVWNSDNDSPLRIAMDTGDRELGIGQSETLRAAVENGPGNGVHPLEWKSSNAKVVGIKGAGASQATLILKRGRVRHYCIHPK